MTIQTIMPVPGAVSSVPAAPTHLGVILDGNRRWARRHGVRTTEAYTLAAAKVPELLGWCEQAGVRLVTLWALSPDNLRRPAHEIHGLVSIIIEQLRVMASARRWCIRIIGDLDLLPAGDALALRAVQGATSRVPGRVVNIAVAYGGREDLLTAVHAVVQECLELGEYDPATVEERIEAHLSTAGQPDPDLVIRTSGEQRTSGFMLWQTAQSELYFTVTEWPDFEEPHLRAALDHYASRVRRFGQ